MTLLMNPVEGMATTPVVIEVRAALGGLTATSGQLHNLGEMPFQYQITLGTQTCAPITIMDGTKWTVPCFFDVITILPRAGQEAWYSLDAEAQGDP